MFRSAPEESLAIMTREKVNAHFHTFCVTERVNRFTKINNQNVKFPYSKLFVRSCQNLTKFGLNEEWHVLATNVDPRGQEFISLIESRQYPFYGIITHPEKNSFEWNPDRNNPHSPNAIKTMNFFANFFVNEGGYLKCLNNFIFFLTPNNCLPH